MVSCHQEGVSPVPAGDYNTSADRHLRSAVLPSQLRPDLLISEATYATTLRDSKKTRERELVGEVREQAD
jgi:integrator complex subunit 11